MKNTSLCYILSAFICMMLQYNQSYSSIAKRLSEEELIRGSDKIILGRVVSLRSYWNDDHRMILTEAMLSIEKDFLEGSSNSVLVQYAGGTVGESNQYLIGGPRLVIDEHVLLFLKAIEDRSSRLKLLYIIIGLSQGKFIVKENIPNKPTKIISSALDCGLDLISDDGNTLPPGGNDGIELNDLVKKIGLIKGEGK